jgi:prepilin-type N-terminal cleavage/methylation domain-containing protein
MKRHFSKPCCSSFTLVELLVVIGIIGILAAVLITSFGPALNSVKRAKAGVLANQLQTACVNYYSEYSLYPVPSTTTTDAYYDGSTAGSDTTGWANLCYTLCGNINPYSAAAVTDTGLNTRNIPYLTPNRSDVSSTGTTGILKNPLPPNGSAAEIYFYIVIDSDYSGIAGDSGTGKGLIPDFANGTMTSLGKLPGGLAQQVLVWANCNQSKTVTNANFYVKTF